MSCQDAAPLLQELVDGALPPAAMAQLNAHLAGCPACRQAYEELASIAHVLGAEPLTPPARDLAPAIAAQALAARAAAGAMPGWLRGVAALILCSCFMAAAALVWALGSLCLGRPVAPSSLLLPITLAGFAFAWRHSLAMLRGEA